MRPSIIPAPRKIKYINGSSVLNNETEIIREYNSSVSEEGYKLTISDNKIHVYCSDEQGYFYAMQTVKQITETCGVVCDNLEIEDWPEFKYRGFSLDCCRHFFGVEDIKKIIDTASLFKMNKFHWHLTDDQGWRLPSEKYPLLNTIGATRKMSKFGGVLEEGEYSFCFTKSDIKEIVDYCAEKYIEVIPEIEMPGHSTAVLASYGNLGCTGEKVELQIKEGIFDTVLCLGNPDTKKFVTDILDEVCEMFPGKYIHIGGDEAPRTNWSKCPKCSEKMKSLGIDSYDELQGYFIKEVSYYLKAKGRTAISWNESLKGDIIGIHDTIIQRWMDKKELSCKFADKGGKIIESDFYHYYCDYPYGMTPVKKTYCFNPINKNIRNKESVLGVEAEMWTEYIRSFDDLCQKYYPRIIAVAERGWCGDDTYDYADFVRRHENLRNLTESYGVKIIPVEEWSMNPASRLADIAKFFKGSISLKNISNSIKNNKSDK